MPALIFLTWDEERFLESISVIDKEACWNGSEALCWPRSLAVGSPDVVSNIELENQRIRITLEVFSGMIFLFFLTFISFSAFCLYSISPCRRAPCLSPFQFLESDFLWFSLSYSVSREELTKSLELMETRCLTPSFREASQNYSAWFVSTVRSQKSVARVTHQVKQLNKE